MKTEHELSLELISQAQIAIEKKIRKTPIEFSQALSDLMGCPVYLKLESMQITGSFKVRGALFYLSTLSTKTKNQGIAACSAGNHGLGVAYAAQIESISCTVYVPKNVDQAKYEKIRKFGAKVIRSAFDGYDDTLSWAEKEVAKTGLHFISAFEDERIMAANGGTLASEIIDEIPDVENIIIPVGGGGLSAGACFFFKETNPSTRTIGCQHIGSAALKISLETGIAATTLPPLDTSASGIEGGIGRKCFEILKSRIDEVSLVNEEEIRKAVSWLLEHHQYLIEPTAAVTVACCLFKKVSNLKGKTVLVLSGRNVALETIKNLVCS